MEEHECIIGEWLNYEDAELITFTELKEKVKQNNNTFAYGLNTYGEHFMNGLMQQLKLKDYFDNRKNVNLNKFNYCPYCGEKINWKKHKEEL